MVAREGVEPTTFWVWTRRSNQLSYLASYYILIIMIHNTGLYWWRWWGSNSRPSACKADALPVELHPQYNGRKDRTWTCDPCVPNAVLFQAELLSDFMQYGASNRSRTHNLLIRSQALYPIELQTHYQTSHYNNSIYNIGAGEGTWTPTHLCTRS